jgi:uncharacterized repeat protein (TIGR01451 family)
MMSSKKDNRKSAGQSMLEFALILPLLMTLTLGIIEFGRILFLYSSVTNAGRTATRYGLAVGNSPNGVPYYVDCAGIVATAQNAILLDTGSPVVVTVRYDRDANPDPSDPTAPKMIPLGNCGTLSADQIGQGDRLVVEVQTQVRPIVSFLPISPLNISTTNARTILKDIQFASGTVGGGGGDGSASCHLLTIQRNPEIAGHVVAIPENCDTGSGYLNGTTVTVTATAEPGFAFLNWTGAISTTLNPATVLLDANKTVVANFAEVCFSLNLNTNPADGGQVTVHGGGTECSYDPALYRAGSQVHISAVPNEGYIFLEWQGGVGSPGSQTTMVFMDEDKSVTAVFEALPPGCFSLSVTAGFGGSVFVPEQTCEEGPGYTEGTVVTFYATAFENFAFVEWTGSHPTSGMQNPIQADVLIDANKSFHANFAITHVDLSVTKAASPDPVLPGHPLAYAIQAINHNPMATATGVIVTDTLPAGVIFQSVAPSQGNCNPSGNVVICTLGNIGPNGVATILIEVIAPTTSGTISNHVAISGDQPDQMPANNSQTVVTTISNTADLSIAIQDSEDPIPAGDTLIYTLTIINHGPDTASDVEVVNTLPTLPAPGEVIFDSVTSSQGSCVKDGNEIHCLLGDMANGASATITIRVIPTRAGFLENYASVSASSYDPNLDNNVAGEGTWVETNFNEYIVLSTTCASPGETISVFGFSWTTNGNPDVVTITWDPNGPDPSQQLGTVPKAQSWSTTVTVPASASEGTHTVRASRKANESDSRSLLVPCPAPNLVVSDPVLVSNTPVVAESSVSFRVSITNTGQYDAAGQFYLSLYLNPAPAPTPGVSTHISDTFRISSLGVNGLAVDESKTFTMTISSGIAVTGTHSIYAVVDSDPAPFGIIGENYETDNVSAALQINVQPCVSDCDPGGGSEGTGGLDGEVYNESLLPQANAHLILYNSAGIAVRQMWSAQNGFYSFTDLAADTYYVTACANVEGNTLFTIESDIVVNEGAFTVRHLLLAAGPCS